VLDTRAAGPSVPSVPAEGQSHPADASAVPPRTTDSRFWVALAVATAVGAVIRFMYLFHGAPVFPIGDGFSYHLEALRIADGLGYTSPVGDIGAELAHHPPGWVTVLAGVVELGFGDLRAHQVTGVIIGLAIIVVIGLVGRRYAGPRVGVVAAFVAAIYPGFWVLEVQILSEPLGLLIIGLLTLTLADLWQRPSLGRAALTGAVAGALALVRSEQVAMIAIAVVPVLLLNPRVTVPRRIAWTGAAAATAALLMAPWTIYNLGRFDEPVLLSTNSGSTLLSGNCPPVTYSGELIGFHDNRCLSELILRIGPRDRSEGDIAARNAAFDNIVDNLDRMPATVLARYGRTLGVFRPSQTVDYAAGWFGSATWPVWAWATSFWLLLPLAGYGYIVLRQARAFRWPLVAPLVITLLVVTFAYGELRYHTPSDLGLVVLAAVGLERLSRSSLRPGWRTR
jgi:4-amino-4-deoxy-L-arabinose transferase-like glycosyltransferase